MKFVLFAFSLLCYSCTLNKEQVRVTYHPVKNGRTFYLNIPKGYTFHWISGGEENEFRYTYDDSSIIYITDFSGGSLNHENIRQQGTYYLLFDVEHTVCDTLTLNGVDSVGLYWKNNSLGRYSVGYLKVEKAKTDKYDKAIQSFRQNK